MIDDYKIIIGLVTLFSFGLDYYTKYCLVHPLKLVQAYVQVNAFKNITSATIFFVLPFKGFLFVLVIGFAVLLISFKIFSSILVWLTCLSIFTYCIYYIGYVYPIMRRMSSWDLKNPQKKWDEIYIRWEKANNIQFYLSLLCTILILSVIVVQDFLRLKNLWIALG